MKTILGYTIKIYDKNHSYIKAVGEDNKQTYGITDHSKKLIIINYEIILKDDINLDSIIMHEVGHIYGKHFPTHCDWKTTSDMVADMFEVCMTLIPEMLKAIPKRK